MDNNRESLASFRSVTVRAENECFIEEKESSFGDGDLLGCEVKIYQDPIKLGNVKYEATFKLVLIGFSGVGKSCIIKRIGSNSFSKEHEVTIGAEFTTIAA